MATHKRMLLRRAIADRLKKAATAAGERVFTSRTVPWRTTDLPGITVITPDEDSEPENMRYDLKRDVLTKVIGVVSVTADLDDQLDSLAQEVEDAMLGDRTCGGFATISYLAHTETRQADEQGRPVGVVELHYAVQYR